jgi:hypothetical protein
LSSEFTKVHAFLGSIRPAGARDCTGREQPERFDASCPACPRRSFRRRWPHLSATARELGISREWASKIANAPETQQIIATLVHAQAERVCDLFEEALNAIAHARREEERPAPASAAGRDQERAITSKFEVQ